MSKEIGFILYEGASKFDGASIVVIAVLESGNVKTGNMVQTYIIRSDKSPLKASETGDDKSVCGDCKLRRSTGGGCYVTLFQGPGSVYETYKRNRYTKLERDSPEWNLFKGRGIRFGAYGDPAAAPFWIWEKLASLGSSYTGYTHQWKNISPLWSQYVMASADSEAEKHRQ